MYNEAEWPEMYDDTGKQGGHLERRKYERLFENIDALNLASGPFQRMEALYLLRETLQDPLTLVLSIDAHLQELERHLGPEEKELMRIHGYQFPEDLDDVPRLLSEEE